MNKAELVEEVAGEVGLSNRTAGKAISATVSAISDCLARGEKVTLVGFGTFQIASKKARRGINPQTGASLQIPAKKVAKFTPGKTLKQRVD